MPKVKVTYGNKITKEMYLTQEQIQEHNKRNKNNKRPYINLEVEE